MTEHECIDCKAGMGGIRARPIATAEGQPKRCRTHLREFSTQQRKLKRARQVEKTYDITAEDNHELYLLQGGKCWLCQKATGATKSLAVDHDHATDEVRGRLCGPCNQFIGRLRDDPAAAQRLVAYLTGDTPYRRLKAAQVLAERERMPSTASIVVHRVYRTMGGAELWAEWSGAAQLSMRWHTSVRDADGSWRAMPGTVAIGVAYS